MKIFNTCLFCILTIGFACSGSDRRKAELTKPAISSSVSVEQSTVSSRFSPPSGFKRIDVSEKSFGHYLRNFPLLPDGESVHLYDGSLKSGQNVHAAVLDIDVGTRDLQQCADATMRLRAEYLFRENRYNEIAFNFTNGWKFEYKKWREGKKLLVKGNKTSWTVGEGKKESYHEFRKYLDEVFMYAGTLSLSKELKQKPLEDIEIGDIIIKGGSPGHAVIIVDICINSDNGDKAFMIAQSYMPAQQIHILKNLQNKNSSPWYLISDIENQIITPEWTFERDQVKTFN